jgi:hypothetical protein
VAALLADSAMTNDVRDPLDLRRLHA